MADYYLKRDMLDEAQEFAMKCTQLNDVLEVSRIKTYLINANPDTLNKIMSRNLIIRFSDRFFFL